MKFSRCFASETGEGVTAPGSCQMYIFLVNKKTLYLSAESQRSLRDLAHRTGRYQAEVIRETLDLYLQQHGERPKPRSIGAGEAAEVATRDSEAWLRPRWCGRSAFTRALCAMVVVFLRSVCITLAWSPRLALVVT